MKVAFLTKTDEKGPASRYRTYQYLPYFRSRSVEVEVYPALGPGYVELVNEGGGWSYVRRAFISLASLLRRIKNFPRILEADVIVIEREFFPCFPPLFELLIRILKGGYVLDFDDAIFLSRGRKLKYPSTVRLAERVIVGNEYLAEFARRYNEKVKVIPTCLDVESYVVKKTYAIEGRPRVGWIGLPYNFPHLKLVEKPMKRLMESVDCDLVVISGREPDIGMPVIFVPWSLETEKEEIARLDVGIMPLFDTPFARGKCGLKILQYMAAGVPVVASPVGVNAEIIRDGFNGFLASTEREWEDKLRALLKDGELRERIGKEGRKTVEKGYSLSAWKEEFIETVLGGER